MYKIEFYVPESHLEAVKRAMFGAGAGKIGNYDSCCWQIKGLGEFRPLEGANPYSGIPGEVERDAEWKVEIVCADELLGKALAALKQAHPYETPAYQYWEVNA